MATLTVNDVELRTLGQESWSAGSAGGYGHIEAVVDVSGIPVASLNVTDATIILALGRQIIEGRGLFQVGSLASDGQSVFVRFVGTDISEA